MTGPTLGFICRRCGGSGIDPILGEGCCGHHNPDGSCCGSFVPAPEPCASCGGGGLLVTLDELVRT